MEELLKLINKTKDDHPSLSTDCDAILEECKFYIETRGDEENEIAVAIEIINDMVKQLEEWE